LKWNFIRIVLLLSLIVVSACSSNNAPSSPPGPSARLADCKDYPVVECASAAPLSGVNCKVRRSRCENAVLAQCSDYPSEAGECDGEVALSGKTCAIIGAACGDALPPPSPPTPPGAPFASNFSDIRRNPAGFAVPPLKGGERPGIPCLNGAKSPFFDNDQEVNQALVDIATPIAADTWFYRWGEKPYEEPRTEVQVWGAPCSAHYAHVPDLSEVFIRFPNLAGPVGGAPALACPVFWPVRWPNMRVVGGVAMPWPFPGLPAWANMSTLPIWEARRDASLGGGHSTALRKWTWEPLLRTWALCRKYADRISPVWRRRFGKGSRGGTRTCWGIYISARAEGPARGART